MPYDSFCLQSVSQGDKGEAIEAVEAREAIRASEAETAQRNDKEAAIHYIILNNGILKSVHDQVSIWNNCQ